MILKIHVNDYIMELSKAKSKWLSYFIDLFAYTFLVLGQALARWGDKAVDKKDRTCQQRANLFYERKEEK